MKPTKVKIVLSILILIACFCAYMIGRQYEPDKSKPKLISIREYMSDEQIQVVEELIETEPCKDPVKVVSAPKYEIISDTMKAGLIYEFCDHANYGHTVVWLTYPEGKGEWIFDAGGNETMAGFWNNYKFNSKKRHTGYHNGKETYQCDTDFWMEAPQLIVIKPYTDGIIYHFRKAIK